MKEENKEFYLNIENGVYKPIDGKGFKNLDKRFPKIYKKVRGGEIALIFQEPMTSFSPVHTVGNQVIEAIQLHMEVSKKVAMSRAEELFDLVGIPNPRSRLNEYAYQLSGGLRQRAMIAMALL